MPDGLVGDMARILDIVSEGFLFTYQATREQQLLALEWVAERVAQRLEQERARNKPLTAAIQRWDNPT